MKFRDQKTLIEQFALIFASFIWTAIVIIALILLWAYKDVQARWEYVVNAPPEALAQAVPAETPSPTVTAWAGPGATLTPTPTLPPTSVPTRVITQPEMLPETLNPGEDPIPVIVHTEGEAQEYGVGQSGPVNINIQPTPVPAEQITPPTAAPPPQPPSGQSLPPILSNPFPDAPPASTDAVAGASPSRLVIDSVGINSDIIPVGWSVIEKGGYEYSIWQVADYAVGWHKTTSPLGQSGNTVMAGHHNVNGEVFRDLVNVEVGDRVTIFAGETRYEYIVDLKTIVKEKGESVDVRKQNAQWIAPTNDERVTFVTCWPYTNNTHRVIVVAKPV